VAEIGRFVDDPDRRKIAGCLVELLLDTDPRDDFLIETLTEAIGLLGPAALPEVVAGLSMSRPDDGGWIALLYLLELGGDRSATTSQQALAVEAAERVLRRVEAGEISASDGGGASMVLAMLGHQPSIGLIERIAQREDQGPMAVWGINEHASALKRLRGEEGRDKREPSPPRWKRPSAELAEGAWRAFAKWRDDYEQQRQSEFNRMCAQLYAAPPLALPAPRIPDPAHAHPPQRTGFANVSRNAKCPCGSGKKYKKCCGPKRR